MFFFFLLILDMDCVFFSPCRQIPCLLYALQDWRDEEANTAFGIRGASDQ